MKKLLLTTLFVLAGCSVEHTTSDPDGGTPPPVESCDFDEAFVGHQSPDSAQFIATLPVFSEYSLCGNNTHIYISETVLEVDQDHYLFPLVSLEDVMTVNFTVNTVKDHIPVVDFYTVYDGLPPVQVGHFIGTLTNLTILDWPVLLLGDFQNDLIVRVSSYVSVPFDASSSENYTLKFW
jgi:hypothetical protein